MSKVLSDKAMSLMAVSHTAHDKISWNALWDYIAELEKDNDEFRQLIHDWIIILTPDDGYVPDSECVRQAMLVIDKERER